jgi:hypothetical protein
VILVNYDYRKDNRSELKESKVRDEAITGRNNELERNAGNIFLE